MKPARAMAADRLEIRDLLDREPDGNLAEEIRAGLTAPRKRIPSKFFYDQRGSRLFEAICRTPEYYLTRTEMNLLAERAGGIMEFFARRSGDLVELGSGSNQKVRLLLDALSGNRLENIRYVPVDISQSALVTAARELMDLYPDLEVMGIIADFTRHLNRLPHGRKLVCFLGSSIGNFGLSSGARLLSGLARAMNPEDRLLLGMDMVKDPDVLNAAYNDRQGVTEQFNLNILNNVNQLAGADFDPGDFEHLAFYNRRKQRVEMHLRPRREISVRLEAVSSEVRLAPDETIHTEISQKYTRESAQGIFSQAGLEPTQWFSDEKQWFSLVELTPLQS